MRRALLILLAVGVALARPAVAGAQAADPVRWLVAPFEQTSAGLQERWIGEAIAVLTADALASAGVPVYSAAERREAWEAHGVSPAATLSRATLVTLGRAARATRILMGTYAVANGQLRIQSRVLETAGPTLGPVVEEAGALADLVPLIGRMGGRLLGQAAPLAGPLGGHPPAAIEQLVRGQLATAVQAKRSHFTQALAIAPALHEAALELWSVHDGLDEHEAALAAARRVPDGTPHSQTAHLRAGLSLLALGRLEEARTLLAILSRGFRDAAVLVNLALVQARLGQPSAESLAEAVALSPRDADVRFNAGYAAWVRGEPATAVGHLREAVRLQLDDAQAHYVLGQALTVQGRPVEAAAEQALAARFSEEVAGLRPEAARGWERPFAEPRTVPSAPISRVLADARERTAGELTESYWRLGREALAQGRHDQALAEFRRAAYLRPYDGVSYRLVAEAFLAAGRAREAVEAATLAVFGADDIPSHLTLADAFDRSGQAAAARAEWQLVLSRDPGNETARRLLSAR